MIPTDIIQFLKWCANSGYAPLDGEAQRLLDKYTRTAIGPSEYKAFETWAMPPRMDKSNEQ